MIKKWYHIVCIAVFLAVLLLPLAFTSWADGGVSQDENRVLAKFPSFTLETGEFNEKFTTEFENWFMDHLGFRQELITANAKLQFRVFDRMLSKSDHLIGRNGDINYATDAMLKDYAHLNLRTEEEVAKIGDSYQTVSDWLAAKNIPFYYVQCFDKHSIYPEQFISGVKPIGDVSKTDQVIAYLENHTSVNTISMKPVMVEAKETYEVYSNWGDPTHWSPRGAVIGYRHIMQRLNEDLDVTFPVLQDSDYRIEIKNGGITLNQVIHQDDNFEHFTIKEPKAKKVDKTAMGQWSEDRRHSVWKNPEVDNGVKLLLMADSYINTFIVDDIAESVSEVWLVWGDYTKDLPKVVELYQPDVVIYECAERVDRSTAVCNLAKALTNQE